jgi:hypothetical protein
MFEINDKNNDKKFIYCKNNTKQNRQNKKRKFKEFQDFSRFF